MSKTCKDCGLLLGNIEFYPRQNDCKECFKSKVRSQKDRLGIGRICPECGCNFKALNSEINRGGGITCSRECYFTRLPKLMEAKNNGMTMTYFSVHCWIKRVAGKPNFCEHCKATEGTFDWSNKSGEYLRNLNDWQRLCRGCHIRYDIKYHNKSDKFRDSINNNKEKICSNIQQNHVTNVTK